MIFGSSYTFPYPNLDLCWQFVADGKLYVAGHNTIVSDNTPEYLVLSTTDGDNWVQVMQSHTTGFVPPSCKLHLPNGQSGYFGWYCYKDNNTDLWAENQFYYYFIPTLEEPTVTPLKLFAPSLSHGGDYWFLGALTAKPIIRGNFLYYSAWCDDNSATRHAISQSPYPTVANNKIRVYQISVDDFCAGNQWTKVADITLDHLYANKIYASETDWFLEEKGDGNFEVVLLIRAQYWDSSNKMSNGTLISRSSDFSTWTPPAFGWNGYPCRVFKDYDGTVHIADAERAASYHWDDPTVPTVGKVFRVWSTDGGQTFSRETIVNRLYNAGGGYATFHRFKDRMMLVYSDSNLSVGYGTVRLTSSVSALTVAITGSDTFSSPTQLTATANAVDVSKDGLWYSSNPGVAIVYNGLVTPVALGQTTITFDYVGYLATFSVTVPFISTNFAMPVVSTAPIITASTLVGVSIGSGSIRSGDGKIIQFFNSQGQLITITFQ